MADDTDGRKPGQLIPTPPPPTVARAAAHAADAAAGRHVFADYRRRIDSDTLRRQEADLALFACYLAEVQAVPTREAPLLGARLLHEATAWTNISWGLIAGFLQWQLNEGYAIGSINVRLATVKRYSGLAHAAGVLSADEIALIRTVRGFSGRQARTIDAQRTAAATPTRRGDKKATALVLDGQQVHALKQQPHTPQGRRDALLVCLMVDHGLRVGEVAALDAGALDLRRRTLTLYREKVHKTQTHRLSEDTLEAARAYLASDAPAAGPLLRGSRKNGELWGTLNTRSIRERIRLLGERIGVASLAPHDLRHTWATRAARGRTDPFALRDAGGWSSLHMPNRYVEAATIANERINLDDE